VRNIYGADRGGQVPVVYGYSLGIQREISKGVTIDVADVSTAGLRLVTARYVTPFLQTYLHRRLTGSRKLRGGVVPLVEPNLPPEYAAAGHSFSGWYAYQQNSLDLYKS
jgi:hypothetical protein